MDEENHEPYRLPPASVTAITRARRTGGRVVALGTTVARALEHAAAQSCGLLPGVGLADQRIDGSTTLQIVDALITGTHERTESHYDVLRAFASENVLRRVSRALDEGNYLTHEFGDSILIARAAPAAVSSTTAG